MSETEKEAAKLAIIITMVILILAVFIGSYWLQKEKQNLKWRIYYQDNVRYADSLVIKDNHIELYKGGRLTERAFEPYIFKKNN